MNNIWDIDPIFQEFLWEDLMAHQKKHGWPSRTVSSLDLIDGLLDYRGNDGWVVYISVPDEDYWEPEVCKDMNSAMRLIDEIEGSKQYPNRSYQSERKGRKDFRVRGSSTNLVYSVVWKRLK